MVSSISIREFGLLGKGGQEENSRSQTSLDRALISSGAYEYLEQMMCSDENYSRLLRPVQKWQKAWLQVRNFVGVIDTPCGVRIEILPKISTVDSDIVPARRQLLKMLERVYRIPLIESGKGSVEKINRTLPEMLISQFLKQVNHLVKRGVRSDYLLESGQKRFLRGRLDVGRQVNMPPSKRDRFCIEYDEYLMDGPENRLIHSALSKVKVWARTPENQRWARELAFVFAELPKSRDVESDLRCWRDVRSIAHYKHLKPWCRLILRQQSPFSMKGQFDGISFLFPIEQLFEKYVAIMLEKQLARGFSLKSQSMPGYLAKHLGASWFTLKPDLLVKKGKETVSILDTKWKLIDESLANSRDKYGLSQSDFYQMFAYGHQILSGTGQLYLIYPSHRKFGAELKSFYLSDQLTLFVVPWDLENDRVVSGAAIDWLG